MSEPLMIDGRPLAGEAEEIIDGLAQVLAFVELVDLENERLHKREPGYWSSADLSPSRFAELVLDPAGFGTLRLYIGRRWILRVSEYRGLFEWIPEEAAVFAGRAAEKLAGLLPASKFSDSAAHPAGGGGGSSGSAEVGIPVWWARRTRN